MNNIYELEPDITDGLVEEQHGKTLNKVSKVAFNLSLSEVCGKWIPKLDDVSVHKYVHLFSLKKKQQKKQKQIG